MTAVEFGNGDSDDLTRFGPTIEAVIEPHFRSDGDAIEYLALIDTGASETCIDAELAVNLGLPAIDRQSFVTASGIDHINRYLARVTIPELGVSKIGRFPGVYLAAGRQHHRLLIGRDLLRQARLVYDGPAGVGTLTFRP